MPKGDFTRFTHKSEKHYTGVLKQQGRVDLDADWNEQVEILDHINQTQIEDIIGPSGVPIIVGGFEIGVTGDGSDLTISPGHIYVNGILCELEAPGVYSDQPDYLNPPVLNPQPGRTDLIYLDVWKRHLTAIEDPEIREKALGGPDTTTRLKTVYQVKVLQNVGATHCDAPIGGYPPDSSGGLLSTQVVPPPDAEDPCLITPSSGYRGLENRLYRVEIHKAGDIGAYAEDPNAATFKWSRDNGSVLYSIEEFVTGAPKQVKVTRLGRDQVLALHKGDWVEVLGDETELKGKHGLLTYINDDIDEARRIIPLEDDVSSFSGEGHPKIRRWDGEEGAKPVTSGPIKLEDGIQIEFSGSNFKVGDYWVFYARTATGEIEPLDKAPPRGIEHHYCRLALVTWAAAVAAIKISDCRPEFPALTQLTNLLYVGGDGQEIMPDPTQLTVPLEYPLQVRVANGEFPVEGAKVRFRIIDGTGGTLAGGASSPVVIATGADGIASCTWELAVDFTNPRQQVEATLLGADGNPITNGAGDLLQVIYFNANLSLTLDYIGGDGQEIMPDSTQPTAQLEYPLQVRVANGGEPAAGAQVRFSIIDGTGGILDGGFGSTIVTPNYIVDVPTGTDGIASCTWELAVDFTNPRQQVEATLLGADGNPITNDTGELLQVIYFNANLSLEDDDCCTVTVHNPSEIQDAIAFLENGGRICILPGDYELGGAIEIGDIAQDNEIIISGCDCRSRIIAWNDQPAFLVKNSDHIKFESLGIVAQSPEGAIKVTDSKRIRITDCCITNTTGFCISIQAEDAKVINNLLTGAGIWIRDGSTAMVIKDNEISGGSHPGPGIGLGGLASDGPADSATGISTVEIVGNHINQMNNSGITTLAASSDPDNGLGEIKDMTIRHNRIIGCALAGPDNVYEPEAVGGITLRGVSQVTIHRNDIMKNGVDASIAACGIFASDCQGLEVTDNKIINNGSDAITPRPLEFIDFRSMESEAELPPWFFPDSLDIDGKYVSLEFGEVPAGYRGLKLNAKTELSFPLTTNQITLTISNPSPGMTVRAFDINNSEVPLAEKVEIGGGETIGEYVELTFTWPRIRYVEFEVPESDIFKSVIAYLSIFEEDMSYQAGIIALFVTDGISPTEGQNIHRTKMPAVRIHDNIVDCPKGRALIVIGIGPISVTDNTLSARAVPKELDSLSQLEMFDETGQLYELAQSGQCVFLLNLGRNVALADKMPAFGINTNSNIIAETTEELFISAAERSDQVPDGRVLFNNNQITLQTGEPLIEEFYAKLEQADIRGLASFRLDAARNLSFDIKIKDLTADASIREVIFRESGDALQVDIDYGANYNNEQKTWNIQGVWKNLTPTQITNLGKGSLELVIITIDQAGAADEIIGQIIKYKPGGETPPLIGGSIGIISLDDVSLQSNQILTEIGAEVMLANVVAFAPTIRATGNRFTELPDYTALLSYLSWADLNITTENQTTHCIYTGGNQWIQQNNQMRLRENCPEITRTLSDIIIREG